MPRADGRDSGLQVTVRASASRGWCSPDERPAALEQTFDHLRPRTISDGGGPCSVLDGIRVERIAQPVVGATT
jgi:hypothetical protein